MNVNRRDVLVLGVGAFVVAAAPLALARRDRLHRRTVPVMGTLAEIAVVHHEPAAAQAAIDAAIAELQAVDRRMTRFTASSDIGRANRRAAGEAVALEPTTAAVLREALAWAQSSDGAFDPALGRAIGLWDVGHRTAPPADRQLRRLAGRRLYRALDVGAWRGRDAVRFTDGDVEVDLGGIAKGFGVDRATDALRARSIERALVNVGGDLYALGESERGEPWVIGIQSPDDPTRVLETLTAHDSAVATSGDYLQYFAYEGRRFHHLLDPDTAAPRRTPVHSVTVVAATCLAADAAATAVYGMPPERAARLLAARAPGARIARTIADSANV
jgi:thiamine biosynthesis lipoprotein